MYQELNSGKVRQNLVGFKGLTDPLAKFHWDLCPGGARPSSSDQSHDHARCSLPVHQKSSKNGHDSLRSPDHWFLITYISPYLTCNTFLEKSELNPPMLIILDSVFAKHTSEKTQSPPPSLWIPAAMPPTTSTLSKWVFRTCGVNPKTTGHSGVALVTGCSFARPTAVFCDSIRGWLHGWKPNGKDTDIYRDMALLRALLWTYAFGLLEIHISSNIIQSDTARYVGLIRKKILNMTVSRSILSQLADS